MRSAKDLHECTQRQMLHVTLVVSRNFGNPPKNTTDHTNQNDHHQESRGLLYSTSP